MKNLSKERLESLKRQFIEDGYNDVRDSEVECLIDMALAGMAQEPVAWWTGPEPTPTGEIESVHDHETGSHPIPLYPGYAAPPAPVVPDAWIPCSERMPEVGDIVLTADNGCVNVGEMERSGSTYRYFTSVISGRELPATHWQPLPAPPNEVKSAFEHGMQRYAGAMKKISEGVNNSKEGLDEFKSILPSLCWCRTCRPVGFGLNDMRFVVCPECGNKRCPKANDHRNACSGSNEPGQEGSAYPDAKEV